VVEHYSSTLFYGACERFEFGHCCL